MIDKIKTNGQLDFFKKEKFEDLIWYHHTLGRWVRNNLGLWQESDLFKFMQKVGFEHPDDMSQEIMKKLWLKINNKDLI